MDIRTWLRSELNNDDLEGTLARYTRPRRGGGSPSMSPKFTAVGSDKTVAAIGANTPQLDEQYTTAEAIASAKDDGTSAPQVAKDYIAAYMADPEWQAWDKTETAAMSHSGWGPIWDANTGGGYSRNKQMNAANASYKKREIEKRYFDRAVMAASKQAAAFADNDKWIGDLVSGMQKQHEYSRQSELDKQKAAESAAQVRLLEEQAKAAAALGVQRGDSPLEDEHKKAQIDLVKAQAARERALAAGGGSARGAAPTDARFDSWPEAYAWAHDKAVQSFDEIAKLKNPNWQTDSLPIVRNKLLADMGWDATTKTRFGTTPAPSPSSGGEVQTRTLRDGTKVKVRRTPDGKWEQVG